MGGGWWWLVGVGFEGAGFKFAEVNGRASKVAKMESMEFVIGDWFRVVSWSLFGWGLVSVAVVGVRKAISARRHRCNRSEIQGVLCQTHAV